MSSWNAGTRIGVRGGTDVMGVKAFAKSQYIGKSAMKPVKISVNQTSAGPVEKRFAIFEIDFSSWRNERCDDRWIDYEVEHREITNGACLRDDCLVDDALCKYRLSPPVHLVGRGCGLRARDPDVLPDFAQVVPWARDVQRVRHGANVRL